MKEENSQFVKASVHCSAFAINRNRANGEQPVTYSRIKNIVMLGCGGFVGSHLLDRLLPREDVVVEGWDPDVRKIEMHLHNPRFRLHRTSCNDPCDSHILEAAIEKADAVLNLAAICNPSEYNTRPIDVIRANLFDVYPTIDLCAKHNRWLIHFSTSEVYGRTVSSYLDGNQYADPDLYELREDESPLIMGPIASQRWTYACAKQLIERFIYAHHREHGMPFTVIRPFNFFGPRMDYVPGRDGEGVPRVLACFMAALLNRTPMQLVDGGQARRTLVAVEEAAAAVELMLDRPERARNQIFNIGNSRNEVTIAELATLMRSTYAEITRDVSYNDHPIENVSGFEFYGAGYEDCDRRMPQLSKADELLGWKPSRSVKEILLHTMRDYHEHYACTEVHAPPQDCRARRSGSPDKADAQSEGRDLPISLPNDGDSSGRTYGAPELDNLRAVLESGTLTVSSGRFAKAFEIAASGRLGLEHVIACNSGTAAVHVAVAALNPEPGSEFIVSPLTDFGGIAPILWQGSIPVFADLDASTYQMTAQTVAQCISDRTAGIIVTHMFGAPAPVDAIVSLANRHRIPVIEDCSQSYLATLHGRLVGTYGDIATFSMQQTKHMSTGEGGFVATADMTLARRMRQFINKARDYSDPVPDHHFLAMNYRMTELEAAVALAQLDRLERFVENRRISAARLDQALTSSCCFARATDVDGARHAFWRYPLVIPTNANGLSVNEVARGLVLKGIPSSPHYKPPAYEWSMMRERRTFGSSQYPFGLARAEALVYSPDRFPGVVTGLSRVLVLPWNERLEADHVDRIIGALFELEAGARRV
ncbi:DegT/DnrJ/EryC1/StrS family aminotransferase (plasmid) [Paraburkholderia sp. PREW-6R]|uniref:DegT/DnrJ/EryC1/StrS family aminotransferase n=1 Tax=Paraburkholderia sp. PREW-6R TaxID=3141544 RepID=UPI0031F5B33C